MLNSDAASNLSYLNQNVVPYWPFIYSICVKAATLKLSGLLSCNFTATLAQPFPEILSPR